MIIPIVIGAFGTLTKGLSKGQEGLEVWGHKRPSKLQHFWERLDYWEESWRLGVTCCHSNSSKKPSANADKKNSIIIIIIIIRRLVENETYKYLGILGADTSKQVEMKIKIQKEYLRRTRKLLETKLSSRNFIKGINTWAVPLVRYSGPFLK